MTTTPDFRALCAELVDELNYYADEHSVDKLISRARAALATPPPEPPASQITFNAPSPPEEVIRLDKEGFHYKGQFVADAGEAHRLMMAFLEQNTKTKPEPPTDEELMALAVTTFNDLCDTYKDYARAVLERWGK